VFGDPVSLEAWTSNPLCLRSYQLAFMASLFDLDLSGLSDGSITCPVVVLADLGDAVFSFDYTKPVYLFNRLRSVTGLNIDGLSCHDLPPAGPVWIRSLPEIT